MKVSAVALIAFGALSADAFISPQQKSQALNNFALDATPDDTIGFLFRIII